MKIKPAYLLAGIPFFIFSCYTPRYMYSPSVQNVPVLVKQGDSKLSASYTPNLSGDPYTGSSSGFKKRNTGFDIQGAIAITDHFAIQANYFNRSERNTGQENNLDSAVINYKRNLTEVGIGYLKSMSRENKVLFQVFGGVGRGNFSFIDRGKDMNGIPVAKNHRTDVLKVYVQPAFIFRLREHFAMSVSTRFSFISFGNIETDYTPAELDNYRLNDLSGGYRTFWEPAFTNSFGFAKLPGVKFEYQILTSLQLSERTIDYRSFNFSLGILFDPGKMFRGSANKGKNQP